MEQGSQLEPMFTLGLKVTCLSRRTESRVSCLQGIHLKGKDQRDPLRCQDYDTGLRLGMTKGNTMSATGAIVSAREKEL